MSSVDEPLQVRRSDEHGRYEAFVGSERVGVADFREVAGSVMLPHVEVDPKFEGRGFASALTRATLDDLRERGVTAVVPSCPYVRAWIGKHAEYQDLVGS